jgi:hypothetical protein
MYDEAQTVARELGYCLVVSPVSPEPGCDWRMDAVALVGA